MHNARGRRGRRDVDLRECSRPSARKSASRASRSADARSKAADAATRHARVLLDAYVAHLERAGKQAAGDARRMFARHVLRAHAELAARQAATITPADIAAIVRAVVDLGKGRTAGKLRSYMRAAYALAQRARYDAAAPAALLALDVEHNPVAATAALSQFNRTRDRVLERWPSSATTRLELERLEPSPARDALRLALLLGGQRPTQLLRAVPGDVDLEARTLVLCATARAGAQCHGCTCCRCPKRPPRSCEKRRAECGGLLLFTTDGKRQTRVGNRRGTRQHRVRGDAEGRTTCARQRPRRRLAQLRDVRRTAETMLARLGVSRDVRAQLQSHGLGGVQQQPLRSARLRQREAGRPRAMGSAPGRARAGAQARGEAALASARAGKVVVDRAGAEAGGLVRVLPGHATRVRSERGIALVIGRCPEFTLG